MAQTKELVYDLVRDGKENSSALFKGMYSHYKEGDLYVFYDVVLKESTQEYEACYYRLATGKKFSRPLEEMSENVLGFKENRTGQTERFELVHRYVVQTISADYIEGTPIVEFLESNNIYAPFKLSDKVMPKNPPYEEAPIFMSIVALRNDGVIVEVPNGLCFLHWSKIEMVHITP